LAADANGNCTLGKETTVIAKAGNDLKWKIENYCLSQQQVSVGDFRLTVDPTEQNCDNEGANYPFEPDARTVTVNAGTNRNGGIKPGKEDLKLKVKGHDAQMTTYYFNICLGGTPADPRLLVER
jgi:hypothetical protein